VVSLAKAVPLSQLLKKMTQAVNDTLENDVAPVAKEILQESIQENVYQSYAPTYYERRGVLGSADSIVSEMESDGVLSIRNVAVPNESVLGTGYSPANDTTFSGWVNDGQVPNIFNDKDYPWMHPRNFIEDAVEKMQTSGEISDAFAAGMAKLGMPSVGKLTIKRK
jgi:hypothetical protein